MPLRPVCGYVALSRLRGLDGLFLQGGNQQALQLHPDMYGFDRQLRQLSAEQAAHTSDAEPEKPAATAVYDEDLFQNCEPGGQSRPKPARGRLYGAARYFCKKSPVASRWTLTF